VSKRRKKDWSLAYFQQKLEALIEDGFRPTPADLADYLRRETGMPSPIIRAATLKRKWGRTKILSVKAWTKRQLALRFHELTKDEWAGTAVYEDGDVSRRRSGSSSLEHVTSREVFGTGNDGLGINKEELRRLVSKKNRRS